MSKKNKSKEPAKKAKHKAKVAQLRRRVAELEAANIEHRQVAEAYQLIVEHSGQGLAIFQNQRLIFANPGLAQISGRSVEALKTLSAQELFANIHPDDRGRVIENIQSRLAGQPAPERYEIRFFHQTGRLLWLELSARLIQYQSQPAIQITYFDITERKQAEEKLRQRTAQLEALRQIGLGLTSELNLDSLLSSIVSQAIELLGATTGGLYLYRPEDDILELVVAVGAPNSPTGLFLKRGEGLSGQVLATGQPMVVDNYHEWAGRADIYADYDFTTIVGVPVQWGQELLGVLNIANRRQPFTAEEVELLNLFTTPAAAAIRNARLVSSLQESKERFRQMAENIEDVFWMTNLDGSETIYVSPAYEKVWGRSHQSIYAQPFSWMDSLHPEDKETIITRFEQRDRTKANIQEYRLIQPDGTVRWIRERSFPVFDETGQVFRIAGVAEDISERKQVETDLAHERDLLQAIMDNLPDSIYFKDTASRFTRVNQGHAEILEYGSPDEVIGKTDFDLEPPELAQAAFAEEQELFKTGQPLINRLEFNPTRAGQPRWLSATKVPLKDHTGQIIGLVGLSRDITNRKLAEEALARQADELEALYRTALEINSQPDLPTLLEAIVERAIKLIGTTRGGLFLSQPGHQGLELVIDHNLSGNNVGFIVQPGQGLVGQVVQTGQPVMVEDYSNWSGRISPFADYDFKRVLGIPLKVKDTVIGVIVIADTERAGAFSPQEIRLVSLFADQAAIALENARLYQQIRQDAEIKEMLLREANHRVKNNLATFIGLLYAERRHAEAKHQPIIQEVMQNLISRVHGLATVHSLLSATQWAQVSLSDLTRQVIETALRVLPPDQRVQVEVSASPVRVTPQQANNLALVINELTTNSVKHAMADPQPARITVFIKATEETIQFEFHSSGPGYPPEILNQQRQNVGLYLIKNIVGKGLRGTLSLDNNSGAVTTICFPISLD